MPPDKYDQVFAPDVLLKLFPPERADEFFEALFGEASEGAYDIDLKYKGHNQDRLNFEFHLEKRPGRCLTCSLTYGLPQVFSRHPVINVASLVQEIAQILDVQASCLNWKLGRTQEVSSELHTIPLTISLNDSLGLA